MHHETAVSNAKDIADHVLAPAARENDKAARFSSEAVKALGPAGLLGVMLPAEIGGAALGPRTFAAVVSALADADARGLGAGAGGCGSDRLDALSDFERRAWAYGRRTLGWSRLAGQRLGADDAR
jgi:alkylation response protein AidB-like acyl-CoA dehydrogenase